MFQLVSKIELYLTEIRLSYQKLEHWASIVPP